MLKIYGDAPLTVSDSTVTLGLDVDGVGSKFTGIIDNVYVNETSNGLAHAVEKFKEFPIAGHVTFRKGERSELATLASKVL